MIVPFLSHRVIGSIITDVSAFNFTRFFSHFITFIRCLCLILPNSSSLVSYKLFRVDSSREIDIDCFKLL